MFSKNLAAKLLRLMEEKGFTQEALAEVCHVSDRFIRNVICERQSPNIDTFEKICEGLEVDPNDLLISDLSRLPDKAVPMPIKKVYAYERMTEGYNTYPVCPACERTLEREGVAYCDRCGQKLSWKEYQKAEVVYNSLPKLK